MNLIQDVCGPDPGPFAIEADKKVPSPQPWALIFPSSEQRNMYCTYNTRTPCSAGVLHAALAKAHCVADLGRKQCHA